MILLKSRKPIPEMTVSLNVLYDLHSDINSMNISKDKKEKYWRKFLENFKKEGLIYNIEDYIGGEFEFD